MTAKLFDRVIVQTSTQGTGDYALGSAADGYEDFGSAGAGSGDLCAYFAADSLQSPTVWEIGEGVFTPGNPAGLTRATIKGSSNAGAAVDWDVGTKFVVSAPSAAWLMGLLNPIPLPVTEQTANYTLALIDAGKYIRMNVATANTVTVPPQSDVAWAADTLIEIIQAGAGQTTIVAGAGVTINAAETLVLAKQYAVVSLKRAASDEWDLYGYTVAA